MIINWIKRKLFPLIQMEEWVIRLFQRLDRIEKDSHPPLFDKSQLHKIHKRLEDLETTAFVKKLNKYDWEGSD